MKTASRPYLYCTFVLAASFVLTLLASPLSAQRPFNVPARAADVATPASLAKSVTVMLEMNAAPAAAAYAEALKVAQSKVDSARNYALANPKLKSSQTLLKAKPQAVQIDSASATKIASQVKQLDQAQQAVVSRVSGADIGGKVVFRAQRAYNGIAVSVSPDKIAELAALPGVKAVHPMHPKSHTVAFSDIDFLNTRPVWSMPPFGIHGENVVVAVIDSGLDYIHTNFGGGGSANYAPAAAASANHTTAPTGFFPTPKVPGGYDFAGDNYDANVPGNDIPTPDPDPFDCGGAGSSGGHGTACASLVAGYGVTNAGFTYAGSYNAANPAMSTLSISPGFAPNAKLMPLRVFGCNGSTNLVVPAIEYAMDPNGDGNFSDHVDVISMSLGSNEGYADDPDDIAATNAAGVGINVCSAAGNAGDTYYIHSSPAAASGTLGVAASYNDQNGFIYDASVTPNTPGAGAPPGGKYFAIYSSSSPHTSVTNDVVYARPANGSTAFTNAAQVAGKIVLIDRGVVTFAVKANNAMAAGAVGIIIANNAGDPIVQATDPVTIPDVMISTNDGNAIKAAAAFDATTGVAANPCNVTIAPDAGTVVRSANAPGSGAAAGSPDTLPTYTSRGPRLPDSAIKPDITAPAEVVGVAAHNTGNGFQNFNGTSSATPHIAGIMALLKQLHPSWTVQERNALATSTATHDLATTVGGATKIGVGRIGAGRVDVGNAGTDNVVAFNGTDSNLVGVSFGVVDVPVDGSRTLTKTVKIVNKGANAVTYTPSIQNLTTAAGATFSVPAAPIIVNGGSTVNLTLTYSATGSALRHDRDLSTSTSQATSFFTAQRQYLTESNGYVVLTPSAGPELTQRVAIYAAPRPVATMHATSTAVVPDAPSGSFTINLSGAPINTGASFPTDIVSMVKAFELQYISPLAGSPSAPSDPNVIKYVGVTSDWANRSAADRNGGATVVTFGIEAFGNATIPKNGGSDKQIELDFDFDSVVDATIYLTALPIGTAGSNVYFVGYVDNAGYYGPAGSGYYWDQMTNGITPGSFTPGAATNRDVNTFNNSAVHIPVDFIVGTGFTSFNYQVKAYDRNGNLIDQTPLFYFDVAAPGIETIPAATFEPFVFNDLPATAITANYNGTNLVNNGSLGVLLLHRHNGDGNRADVVRLRKPTISSFTPTSGQVGSNVTITGSNFGPGTIVKFTSNKTAVTNVITSTTLIATVPPGAVTGPIRVSNAAGSSTSPGVFTVLP